MQEKLRFSNLIKERIIYFVENQRIKKVDFFSRVGVTSANFRGDQLKSSLSSTTIERIISEYPSINLYWLITGKGSVLNREDSSQVSTIENVDEQNELISTQRKLITAYERELNELRNQLKTIQGKPKAS